MPAFENDLWPYRLTAATRTLSVGGLASGEAIWMSVTRVAPEETCPQTETAAAWWRLPQIWGALAITAMWLAVIFVGVYGDNMTFASPSNGTTAIPIGVVVAICAAFATASVSKRVFRR